LKKSSEKPKSNQNDARLKHLNSIEVWKTFDRGNPLSPEAEKMLNNSLFELWGVLQEAMGYAALIGADSEQYRDEIRQLVELVEPRDDRTHEKHLV